MCLLNHTLGYQFPLHSAERNERNVTFLDRNTTSIRAALFSVVIDWKQSMHQSVGNRNTIADKISQSIFCKESRKKADNDGAGWRIYV